MGQVGKNIPDAGEAGLVELLLYIECASYYSADFELYAQQAVRESIAPAELVIEDAQVDGPADDCDGEDDLTFAEGSVEKKKVVQVDSTSLMLIRARGRLAVVRANTLTWLQVCDNNSSENCKAALSSQWIGTSHASKFKVKLRLACTDGASAISKADRWILHDREDWFSLRFTRRAHMVQNTSNRVYDLQSDAISGSLSIFFLQASKGQTGQSFSGLALQCL